MDWQADWQQEIARRITVDLDGETRYNGRTAQEVLAEKDEGRVFCTGRDGQRWEGREVQGRREGRWRLFTRDALGRDVLRFDVIYVNDQPAHALGYRPDGTHDPGALPEGRWLHERSDYAGERLRLCRLIARLSLPDDLPDALRHLSEQGASRLQIIHALRELTGCPLQPAARAVDHALTGPPPRA